VRVKNTTVTPPPPSSRRTHSLNSVENENKARKEKRHTLWQSQMRHVIHSDHVAKACSRRKERGGRGEPWCQEGEINGALFPLPP